MSVGFGVSTEVGHLEIELRNRMLTPEQREVEDRLAKQQAKIAADSINPDQVRKATAKGLDDGKLSWTEVKGTEPARLNKVEALRLAKIEQDYNTAQTMLEAGVKPIASEKHALVFPRKVYLVDENKDGIFLRKDFTGDAGGVSFEQGMSTGWQSYRRVMSLTAAGFRLVDAILLEEKNILLELSPHTIDHKFTAENIFWLPGQPLPQHAIDFEAAHMIPVVSAPAQVIPAASVELNAAPVEKRSIAAPADVIDAEKLALIVKILPLLRPGHKEDWAADGLPDCNRLSALLSEHSPVDATYSRRVTKKEREFAWRNFTVNKIDPQNVTNAFAVPTSNSAKDILSAAADKNGLRMLRQLAEAKGIQSLPKEKDAIIDELLKVGVTVEEARKLI